MKNIKWTYSPLKGKPGQCFQAQVFDEKGQAIARIYSTENSREATEIARLVSEAPELKEQNEKMRETLKKISEIAKQQNYWVGIDTIIN